MILGDNSRKVSIKSFFSKNSVRSASRHVDYFLNSLDLTNSPINYCLQCMQTIPDELTKDHEHALIQEEIAQKIKELPDEIFHHLTNQTSFNRYYYILFEAKDADLLKFLSKIETKLLEIFLFFRILVRCTNSKALCNEEFSGWQIPNMNNGETFLGSKLQVKFEIDGIHKDFVRTVMNPARFPCGLSLSLPNKVDIKVNFVNRDISLAHSCQMKRAFCGNCKNVHFVLPLTRYENKIFEKVQSTSDESLRYQIRNDIEMDINIETIPEEEDNFISHHTFFGGFQRYFRRALDPLKFYNYSESSSLDFFTSICWIINVLAIIFDFYPTSLDLFILINYLGSFRMFISDTETAENLEVSEETERNSLTKKTSLLIAGNDHIKIPKESRGYTNSRKSLVIVIFFILISVISLFINDWNFELGMCTVAIFAYVSLFISLMNFIYVSNHHYIAMLREILEIKKSDDDLLLSELIETLDSDTQIKFLNEIESLKSRIIHLKKNLIPLELSNSIGLVYNIVVVVFGFIFPLPFFTFLTDREGSVIEGLFNGQGLYLMMMYSLPVGFICLYIKIYFGIRINQKAKFILEFSRVTQEIMKFIKTDPKIIITDYNLMEEMEIDPVINLKNLHFQFNLSKKYKKAFKEQIILVVQCIVNQIKKKNIDKIKFSDLKHVIFQEAHSCEHKLKIIDNEIIELAPILDYKLLGVFSLNQNLLSSLSITMASAIITSVFSYVSSKSSLK